MADGRSFGDSAGTASNVQPRAFHTQDSDSKDLVTVVDAWRQKQVQDLQGLREQVDKVTHGNSMETAAIGALALGAVALDAASHGRLHKAAAEMAPEAAKALGFATKYEALARTGSAVERMALRDSSPVAENIFNHKPKSVAIGDVVGWQEAELQHRIRGDKTVRSLTADFREAKSAHTQVVQDLALATRDQTQLSTELKALKQLQSETVDSPLTAESSSALRRIKTAQQSKLDTATVGTQKERDSALRSVELAKENFEKARAAAPARIAQIEGGAGKPGLLTRVNEHIASLQAKANHHVDTIADITKQAAARMDSLKESKIFEPPTSIEDQAFRKRERDAGISKPPRSILTAEERTGIAAPPAKPSVFESAKVAVPEKPPEKVEARVVERPEAVIPVRVETAAKQIAPDVPRGEPKPAPVEVPAKAVVKGVVTALREASGYESVDASYAAALGKTDAFRASDGKTSLRGCLTALKAYTTSVSETMKTELDVTKREDLVKGAVRDLEQLLQPLDPSGRAAAAESLKSIDTDKRFLHLSSVIDNRLAGIDRGIAQRAAALEKVERPVVSAAADLQLTAKTRSAIEAFAKVQQEIPADARVYAVRANGTIVDATIPSTRDAGVSRTVPKRVEAKQISDLGAEAVLGRNFGKGNDIDYFVVVENKRDASGAVIITNADEIAAAQAEGRKSVNPIPDQVVSQVIGNVSNNGFRSGTSFRDFYKRFNLQQEKAVAAKS